MSIPNFTKEIGPAAEVTAALDAEISKLLADVLRRLKGRRKNRAEVAAELTALSGMKVTKRMLDDWCSPSHARARFPLSMARAVCEVTESDDLAFVAMRQSLRERAELGARAIELCSLLEKMASEARSLTGSKRRGRGGEARQGNGGK